MRLLNKYKLHEHYASADWKLPKRVFNFKRPKWAKVKKKLYIRRFLWVNKRRVRVIPSYANHIKIQVDRKFFVKKIFKVKQQARKFISSLFEKGVNFKKVKKNKDRNSVISSHIVQHFFRLDILLWYLKFFPSSIEARAFINGRNVLINDTAVAPNYILKEGDVISFDFNENIAERNEYYYIKNRYKNSRRFFPFLEFDYYTNKIIVLKNWNQLSIDELALTVKSHKKLKYAF